MHALSTIANAVGRCGKAGKIYCDMRLSCGQLIQQRLETCAGRNEDKPATRFKRCARSEPTLTPDRHRLAHTTSCLQRMRHSARRRDAFGTARAGQRVLQDDDDAPTNHYTINIYLSSAASADDQHPGGSGFSVDRLARNVASGSPIVEGLLRGADPSRDRDCIAETLGTFWRDVLENSRAERGFDETPLEKKSEDATAAEPYFLNVDRDERIYVNRDFGAERKEDQPHPAIPHYEKGLYDSRTVTPRRIISSSNQSRRRLSQETEEVTKQIEHLVKLSAQNHNKESRFSKLVSYCKSFLGGEKIEDATENERGRGSLGRKYHTCNNNLAFISKRHYSSYRSKKDEQKSLYRSMEKSRHCLAGAAIEKGSPVASRSAQDEKKTKGESNLARNASKFTLFNAMLSNSANVRNKENSRPNSISIKTLRFANGAAAPRARASHSKSETALRPEPIHLKPKRAISDNKLSYGKFQVMPFMKAGEEPTTEKELNSTKILRKRKRKSKIDLLTLKNSRLTVKTSRDKPRAAESAPKLNVSSTRSLKFDDYNKRVGFQSKIPQRIDAKRQIKLHQTTPIIKFDSTSKKPVRKSSRSEHKKTFKPTKAYSTTSRRASTEKYATPSLRRSKPLLPNTAVTPRRTTSSCGRRKGDDDRCPTHKKHTTKERTVPTHQRLARRGTDSPKEPLGYESLYARCEESARSAKAKRDIVEEVDGLLDDCKREQFKCYFGRGGYKNREYYAYTRSSFYDLNGHMSPSRNAQPRSGSKPK